MVAFGRSAASGPRHVENRTAETVLTSHLRDIYKHRIQWMNRMSPKFGTHAAFVGPHGRIAGK